MEVRLCLKPRQKKKKKVKDTSNIKTKAEGLPNDSQQLQNESNTSIPKELWVTFYPSSKTVPVALKLFGDH